MDVTNDLDEFLGWVRPGDVIAFDTLKAVSGLVQWADNAPVNHVALMIDGTALVMANEPPENDPDAPVISTHVLGELLAPEAKSRAAHILRHPALGADELARLLGRVDWFRARPAEFAGFGMVALLPSTLARAYHDFAELSSGQSRLVRRLLRAFHGAGVAALERIPDDARTLTCSEFVYRCFVGASLDLTIVEPLGRTLPTAKPFDGVLAKRDAAFWDAHEAHNRRALAAGGSEADQDGAAVPPERVTPGDFWRSPSLDPVGYFVKTPPR